MSLFGFVLLGRPGLLTNLLGAHTRSSLGQPSVVFEEGGTGHPVLHDPSVPDEGCKHCSDGFSHRWTHSLHHGSIIDLDMTSLVRVGWRLYHRLLRRLWFDLNHRRWGRGQ